MIPIDTRARAVVRDLQTYRPGTSIKEAKQKARRASVVKMASNENMLGPSPKAINALRKLTGDLHRYPDETCGALRSRLAQKLGVDPSMLIVGNGSDELIVLALRAFVDPGDEVIVARPTFLMYEIQANACGASVTAVPLKDYRYDLVAMRAAVTSSTKLVFIANPDNPTGTYVNRRNLERFLHGLPTGVIVFLDEAYYEFVEAKDFPKSIKYAADQPVIVTRSFSKAYGLAGLRVGYGIGQAPLIAAMQAVREPFNVNSLAQAAAEAALGDTAFLAKSRALVASGYRYLSGEFDRLRLRYVPSVTNFILIELGPRASEVAGALLLRGIIVREMHAWNLSDCIRVTIGTKAENRAFIKALESCLTG